MIKHCMCGCMYDEAECPNCNKVTIEELQDRIERAIAAAEQPHYGDTGAKLDHYYEALCILKGVAP